MTPPGRSQVVIIGGGVVGCSVAYHLALRGVTDVTLVSRNTADLARFGVRLLNPFEPTGGPPRTGR